MNTLQIKPCSKLVFNDSNIDLTKQVVALTKFGIEVSQEVTVLLVVVSVVVEQGQVSVVEMLKLQLLLVLIFVTSMK